MYLIFLRQTSFATARFLQGKRPSQVRTPSFHRLLMDRTYLFPKKLLAMNTIKTARQGIQRERKNYGLCFRNPLNIRQMPLCCERGHGHRRGPRRQAGFYRFPHFDAGICAAIRLAAHYMAHGGCHTVGQLLEHWAPSHPWAHKLYVASVCGRCNLAPTTPLRLHSAEFARLLSALAKQETGLRLSPLRVEELRDGMQLPSQA